MSNADWFEVWKADAKGPNRPVRTRDVYPLTEEPRLDAIRRAAAALDVEEFLRKSREKPA